MMPRNKVDFHAINRACLRCLPDLLNTWLPGGVLHGHEYQALNPTRVDRNLGSFKINTRTGRWGDFATGDSGSDVISLYAYLKSLSQGEAARCLQGMVGAKS